MSRSYFNEDDKLYSVKYSKWSMKSHEVMRNLLREKGYFVNCVARRGCDRVYHDAWQVERKEVPRLIEQLFRQRLVVEVQAEGHGNASINFVYDYSEDHIINSIRRFQKNKEVIV